MSDGKLSINDLYASKEVILQKLDKLVSQKGNMWMAGNSNSEADRIIQGKLFLASILGDDNIRDDLKLKKQIGPGSVAYPIFIYDDMLTSKKQIYSWHATDIDFIPALLHAEKSEAAISTSLNMDASDNIFSYETSGNTFVLIRGTPLVWSMTDAWTVIDKKTKGRWVSLNHVNIDFMHPKLIHKKEYDIKTTSEYSKAMEAYKLVQEKLKQYILSIGLTPDNLKDFTLDQIDDIINHATKIWKSDSTCKSAIAGLISASFIQLQNAITTSNTKRVREIITTNFSVDAIAVRIPRLQKIVYALQEFIKTEPIENVTKEKLLNTKSANNTLLVKTFDRLITDINLAISAVKVVNDHTHNKLAFCVINAAELSAYNYDELSKDITVDQLVQCLKTLGADIDSIDGLVISSTDANNIIINNLVKTNKKFFQQ